jgi:type IV pilus assembly protein PilM
MMEKTPEDLLAEQKGEPVEQEGKGRKEEKKEPVHIDDPRVEKYAMMLKELVKQSKATTNVATASLPVSQVFHTVLTLPIVDKKELDGIVKGEIRKFLRQPVEQMQIMHQIVPTESKKNMRVLVTAAPRSIISFFTAIFQRAGIELRELETEAFALERSLVGRDKATVMVVDIGSERTNFFIIDQSLPTVHRSIHMGGDRITDLLEQSLGVERSMAEIMKMDMSRIPGSEIKSDMFDRVIDPIVKEIQYGFDVFLRQNQEGGKTPEKIILTGGSSVIPFFSTRLSEVFNMKVFVGDPWARVVYQDSLKPVLDSIGPRMAVSIGLALRNILKG